MNVQLRALFAGAVLIVVGACGGGGGGSSAPPAASPPPPAGDVVTTISGTITGFGSVIIDGVKYGEGSAEVRNEVDPSRLDAATAADLKLGQRVEAKAVNGVLQSATIRAALRGPVEAIDLAAPSLTLYRQVIKVVASGDGATVFEGATSLADLTVGNLVEVHATIDASKALVATRIERKPAEPALRLRVAGVISALDATARTFTLGSLVVDYASASVLPAGATLANGQMVFVFSDSAPVGGRLTARSLRVGDAPSGSGDVGTKVAIGGTVSDYVSNADFRINGIRIDASAAKIEPAGATIANGKLLRIEGTTTAPGAIKASEVKVQTATEARRMTVTGAIGGFVSAASFKLRGITVDASAASFTRGALADLANGVWVTVAGSVQGDQLKAETIELVPPPAGVEVSLTGVVSDWDATARSFKLTGVVPVVLASAAEVSGCGTGLANGRIVKIEGRTAAASNALASTPVTASKVECKSTGATPVAPVAQVAEGVIYDLASDKSAFKVNGQTFRLDAETRFADGKTSADLTNGLAVLVKAVVIEGKLMARQIELRAPAAATPQTIRISGAVREFESAGKFMVGPVKVDASAASFVNGAVADLKAGALVEVTGTPNSSNAALKAAQVRFL